MEGSRRQRTPDSHRPPARPDPPEGRALADDELDDEGLERGADPTQTGLERWKPDCKIVGGALGAAAVYALSLVGIDFGDVVGSIADVVGIDPPSETAIATGLGAIGVAYLCPPDLCRR